MASVPIYKVYDANNNYLGCMKQIEDCAAVLGLHGMGSTIRWHHKTKHILWTEGINADGIAYDSYDAVVLIATDRMLRMNLYH